MFTNIKDSIKFKLFIQIGLLLAFILFAIGYTLITLHHQKVDTKIINLAGRQRMLSQKMTKETLAINSMQGVNQAKYIKMLAATSELFDKSLNTLINGDETMKIPPVINNEIIAQLGIVSNQWTLFKRQIDILKKNNNSASQILEAVNYIESNNMSLLKEMNKAVGLFEKIDVAKSNKLINILYFLIFSSIILTLFISHRISKNIVQPIIITADEIQRIAKGNYSKRLSTKSKDEIGMLRSAINQLAENIETRLQEKTELTDSAAESTKAKEYLDAEYAYLEKSVVAILAAMHKFSEGDLTVSVKADRDKGEIHDLFEGFNFAVQNIREVVTHLTEAIEATASASTQISSSTEEMSAGAQEQSAQTSEVSAAMEQMAATIIETTQNATQAAEVSKHSGVSAKDGGDIVQKTIGGIENIANVVSNAAGIIEELGDSSNKIGEIIQVINDIADQTNLLALNAAIEAARAGEQGRGFAVVADEVRKLAERTTTATKEIAVMIKRIQGQSDQAVKAMHAGQKETVKGKELALKAGTSLDDIMSETDNVMNAIQQVAAASEEQSATIELISKNIEGINTVSQETALGIQQVARATEDLNQLTEQLLDMTTKFKITNINLLQN